MPAQYTIEALARGLHVLTQFDRDRPSLSMTDLIRLTGINKATMFRILSTLEELGYLERDAETRHYRPGIKVLRLGFTALASLDIRQIARPHLERLSETLQLTASLSVLDGLDIIYLDRVRNREIVGVVLGLGSRIPAHCASMGKVMLAFLPEEDLDARLKTATLTACTTHTITDLNALYHELETIRATGVAFNIDELAVGLRAVAAPVLDQNGHTVAAINVSGSSAAISVARLKEELVPQVQAAARQISQLLI